MPWHSNYDGDKYHNMRFIYTHKPTEEFSHKLQLLRNNYSLYLQLEEAHYDWLNENIGVVSIDWAINHVPHPNIDFNIVEEYQILTPIKICFKDIEDVVAFKLMFL